MADAFQVRLFDECYLHIQQYVEKVSSEIAGSGMVRPDACPSTALMQFFLYQLSLD